MFTLEFFKAVFERAGKTVAQNITAAILATMATIGVGAGLLDMNWTQVLSVAALEGLLSILTYIGSSRLSGTGSPSLTGAEILPSEADPTSPYAARHARNGDYGQPAE